MRKTSRVATVVAFAVITFFGPPGAGAETVVVKYRGSVDLARMTCETITRSSFIKRLCYDAKEQYVVVALDTTYYHYCGVPADTVANWRAADSMGRFYNAQIKGRFDCRRGHIPEY